MSKELFRHVKALVSDFAAEHGELDLVGRRMECEPADRDALVDRFDAYGVVGGAGVRIHDDRGVLLVRYDETSGWLEPGAERLPGESYRECARRALAEVTPVEAAIEELAQVHLLYMDDRTARQPVPNPYLVFEGRKTGGSATSGRTNAETRWVGSPPSDPGYAELAELSLPE